MRGRRRHVKGKIFIFLVLIIILFFLSHTFFSATNVLKSVAEATMRSLTTEAVNDAVYYTLSDNLRYEDLIEVKRGESNEILSISANSLKINRIARDAAYMSQKTLNERSSEGIYIPLGAFTGVEMLAGYGPKVHVNIIPISNVECRFVSSFESVGVNQTKHSIYLKIVADISIIMTRETSNFASTTEVLIAESVLSGKVPSVYLGGNLFGNNYPLGG